MQIRDIILGAEISAVPDPVWRQICRCTVMKTSFNLHFTTRSNVESDYTVNYKPESRSGFMLFDTRRFYNFHPDAVVEGTCIMEMRYSIPATDTAAYYFVDYDKIERNLTTMGVISQNRKA